MKIIKLKNHQGSTQNESKSLFIDEIKIIYLGKPFDDST